MTTVATAPEVAVVPARILHERPRLATALQRVTPVTLVPLEVAPERGFDGVIAVGGVPVDAARRGGLPVLQLEAESVSTIPFQRVRLVGASLSSPLRGRVLREDHLGTTRVSHPVRGESVLAEVDDAPVWVSDDRPSEVGRACLVPRELGPIESIRDRFLEGEFLALLPVLDFLRRLAGDSSWVEPPLRAALAFDDPNLRWWTYGFLDYRDLVAHARENRYHAAVAMISIDSGFVHRGVATLFAESADVLSLLAHGSTHYGAELREGIGMRRARQIASEAVAARRKLAARHGLGIDPVMVAPHETFGSESLVALAEAGFHARCSALGSRQPGLPCANWHAAEWGGTPLPAIPRRPLGSGFGELALRAHLGQPIIIAGHHTDLQDGLGALLESAAEIESLGDVEWMSLARISTSNFATRRQGRVLDVRLYSRCVAVDVPEGVSHLRVEPPVIASSAQERLVVSGAAHGEAPLEAGPLEIEARAGIARIELRRSVPASEVVSARRIYGPCLVGRRAITEARDRFAAARRRPRTGPGR